MNKLVVCLVFVLNFSTFTFSQEGRNHSNMEHKEFEIATLGAGCFWCVEAIFESLKGVDKVESGYSGGAIKNPTYKEICSGLTGHAEVVRIHFDPAQLTYSDLLRVFFVTHDPTTLNQQGADKGTQYRSVIFYHSVKQKELAHSILDETVEKKIYDDPIVTEISEATTFYVAEDYHQNYYLENTDKPYCRAVITPKVQKFRKNYEYLMKDGANE